MPSRASISSSSSSSRSSYSSSSYSSRPSYSSSSYSSKPVPPRPIAPPPTPKTNGITLSKPSKPSSPSFTKSNPLSPPTPKTNGITLSKSSSSNSTKSNPPPPVSTSTVPASTSASTGGFFSNMMDGLSWGTGQSIANNTVSRLFNWGAGSVHSPSPSTYSDSNTSILTSSTPTTTKSCDELNKQFKECMELNGNSHLACENAFKAYESCVNASK